MCHCLFFRKYFFEEINLVRFNLFERIAGLSSVKLGLFLYIPFVRDMLVVAFHLKMKKNQSSSKYVISPFSSLSAFALSFHMSAPHRGFASCSHISCYSLGTGAACFLCVCTVWMILCHHLTEKHQKLHL